MNPFRKIFLIPISMVALALSVSGCVEEYEPVAYNGFPYGNDRTAGSGIAYVRINLLPSKGTVVEEPLAEETTSGTVDLHSEGDSSSSSLTNAVDVPDEKVQRYREQAEKLFKEMQTK